MGDLMKRFEFVGLIVAMLIILSTYFLDIFYEPISKQLNASVIETNSEPVKEIFKPLNVKTSKINYYRYNLVKIIADYRNYNKEVLSSGSLYAKFYHNNKLIKTITDMEGISLTYNSKTEKWEGVWPIPWNPALGEYKVLVIAKPSNPGPVLKETAIFNIQGKEPPKVPNGFCVMALETHSDVLKKKIEGPDGKMGNWKNIINWAKYMGADAIFALAGMTDGYLPHKGMPNLFRKSHLRGMDKLSAEAHKKNLKYGAWVMSYMMQVKNFEAYGYNPSIGYNSKTGALTKSYHISMGDKKRLQDLINIVKKFDKNPNVDFIGIDYIRSGHADGYEMVDEIVNEMSIKVPSNWDKMGKREHIIWFAKQIEIKKDKSIIEKWRWWRAHKSATIVKNIIEKSGTKKPIWLFSLGWNHGKEHGQDPLMFNDAGVTYDAVMLYEANQMQFRKVLIDWHGYLRAKQVNVICGNSVDTKLLDSPYITAPEEIVRRTMVGSQKLLFGGITDGIFWHDLSRALWGRRKGEFSSKEWCITGGTVFSKYREEVGKSLISVSLDTPKSSFMGISFPVEVKIENTSLDTIKNLKVKLLETEVLKAISPSKEFSELSPGETKTLIFQASIKNIKTKYRANAMTPIEIKYNEGMKYFDFNMIKIRRYKKKKTVKTNSVHPVNATHTNESLDL